MDLLISLSVLASFLATCIVARKLIRKAQEIKLLTFCLHKINNVAIQAVLCCMCITGFMDDLLGRSKGLKEWQKPIFTHFAAMLLMVAKI